MKAYSENSRKQDIELRPGSAVFDEALVFSRRFMLITECYILRNQFATARGSNLTHVPILKHGYVRQLLA